MNHSQKQLVLFALSVMKRSSSNVYKRARFEAAIDNMFVKLTVAPLQKAFRNKYPPYNPNRSFCPNPKTCHFGLKTPYLHNGYCPICDDSLFCVYCSKLIAGNADVELVLSADRHICNECNRKEIEEYYKECG